ncbi:hypothetical protein Leryth_000117 [Lithospermum erythrorhizon]|nr:hypothetical protein Leryth_000117 [Lithospermum erythrorhizon]
MELCGRIIDSSPGKRGCNSTSTPAPTWRFGLFQNDGCLLQEFNLPSNNNTLLSARKLAANLWEIEQPLQVIMMKQLGERNKVYRDNSHVGLVNKLHEPFEKITSSDVKRKGIKEQHHQSVERNGSSLQASTVASYSSSMEMTPYRPTFVPKNSLKFKTKLGEHNFNLTTSTELMRVLNRIWTLEEQHVSAKSLAKALKRELDRSQTRIHELQLGKKRDQDHLVQSIKQELEDERKLRKHSETLHRKIGRQLSEVNPAYANALKEIERERNTRILLEELCDEFAKGIKEYDQEVRFLKQNNKNDQHIDAGRHTNDGLILHLSEAWIDERMQMKQSDNLTKQKTIAEKLSCEIETLLQAKRNLKSKSVKKMQADEATKKEDSSKLETRLEDSRKYCRKQKMNAKNTRGSVEITPLEDHRSQNMKISELIKNDAEQRKKNEVEGKNYYLHSMFHRTNSLPIESKQMQVEKRYAEDAFDPAKFTGPLSPVEKWTSSTTIRVPEISEHSKRSQSVKENTLQALLLEARLETQKDRSREARGLP